MSTITSSITHTTCRNARLEQHNSATSLKKGILDHPTDQGTKGDSGPSLNGIQTELSSNPPNRIERKSKKHNNGSKEQDMIQVTQFTKLNETKQYWAKTTSQWVIGHLLDLTSPKQFNMRFNHMSQPFPIHKSNHISLHHTNHYASNIISQYIACNISRNHEAQY